MHVYKYLGAAMVQRSLKILSQLWCFPGPFQCFPFMNKGGSVCSQEISHIDLIWLFSSLGSGVEEREVQGSVCLSFVSSIDMEI